MKHNIIDEIRSKIVISDKNTFLEDYLEVNGKRQLVGDYISAYVMQLTTISKVELILDGLKQNLTISQDILNYESIDSICESIIIEIICH